MSDIVKIFALGGLDEDGKNMYVVEINDDIFVLEAGIKYPESSLPGIDIIIPDMTYLEENKERVKAYIITHGHDDNMGSLSYALKAAPAPVYCSKVTVNMIKDNFRRYRENPKVDFHVVESSGSANIAGRKFKFFSTSHSVAQSFGVAIDTTQGYVVYTGDFIIDCGAYDHFKTDLNGNSYYFRFSYIHTHQLDTAVLRILNNHKELDIEDLSKKNKQNQVFKQWCQFRSGLIIISGPTGSGA